MTRRVEASAHARVGLLGNPSDAYGGKAIAFSLANFSASVTLEAHASFCIEPPGGGDARWASLADAAQPLRAGEGDEGVRLLRAALRRFALRFPQCLSPPAREGRGGVRLRWETDVPRQVGLAGSSAIVTACLRVLATWFDLELDPDELAALALAAEVEELGIAAGPMDRVIQAHGGCMWMDFGERPARQRLDPRRLPPMFVAFDPRGGEPSGVVHSDVRARHARGDPEVCEAMTVFPRLVDEGLACLERGDHARFAQLVDRNFDTRAMIFDLVPRDRELVAIGRARGHAVKQTGSGGAVVGVLASEADREATERAYEAAGYRTIRPVVAESSP